MDRGNPLCMERQTKGVIEETSLRKISNNWLQRTYSIAPDSVKWNAEHTKGATTLNWQG